MTQFRDTVVKVLGQENDVWEVEVIRDETHVTKKTPPSEHDVTFRITHIRCDSTEKWSIRRGNSFTGSYWKYFIWKVDNCNSPIQLFDLNYALELYKLRIHQEQCNHSKF